MKRLVKAIVNRALKNRVDPLITITISRSALLHNLEEFRKINPENKVIPVLKSNAYGHGLIEVANILKNEADLFAIDSYFEAEHLRSSGIDNPLLVIGYVKPEIINLNKLRNVSFTITSLDTLFSINSKAKIHLKVDTGMNRQGVLIEELNHAIQYIKDNKNITLEGICSHLADADNTNPDFTRKQIILWNSIVEKVKNEFKTLRYTHLSNTFGHRYVNEINANTSRLGIGLYGLAQIPDLNLKPALSLNTIITSIKKIRAGEVIGYNNTYTAEKDLVIATIPVGYYEGLDRNLSNKGFVKINNKLCPIIGRVSMNITTIDVSEIENLKIGDQVNVISDIASDKNSIINIANLSNKITYELVVKIPANLKRVVTN